MQRARVAAAWFGGLPSCCRYGDVGSRNHAESRLTARQWKQRSLTLAGIRSIWLSLSWNLKTQATSRFPTTSTNAFEASGMRSGTLRNCGGIGSGDGRSIVQRTLERAGCHGLTP